MSKIFQVGQSAFRDVESLESAISKARRDFPSMWKKALHDSADIPRKHLANNFEKSGAKFSQQWTELALSTQKQRLKKGYKPQKPILVRRGWLRASVTNKNSKNHKQEINENGITLYSTLTIQGGHNLFDIHQHGTKKIPARPMSNKGNPQFIDNQGWKEIEARLTGLFLELRERMES